MNTRVWTRVARTTVFLAALFFIVVAARAVLYAPTDEIATPPSEATEAPLSAGDYPARLRIPALSIDAKVQQVGLTKSGAMGTPNNFTDVAWYKYGTVPGQVGSAVIDGHVDNGLALAGVFKKLRTLAVGDDIYVDTASSTTLHFLVIDIESYPYQQVPTAQIFTPTDAVRLNLITCEGTWVAKGKTYNERLVVYAVLVKTPQ